MATMWSPLRRNPLRQLDEVFPSLAARYHVVLAAVPIATIFVAGLLTAAFINCPGCSGQVYTNARLARDFFDKGEGLERPIQYEWGLSLIGVPFTALLVGDMVQAVLNNGEGIYRPDLYSNFLVWLAMVVPAWALFALFSSAERDSASISHSDTIVFITFVNNLLGAFLAGGCLIRGAHPDDEYVRPVICIVLQICQCVYSLLNLAMDLKTPDNRDPAVAEPVLYKLAVLFSISIYVMIALGVASIATHVHEHFSNKQCKTLTRNVEIIFSLSLAVAMYVGARILENEDTNVYSTPSIPSWMWWSFELQKTGYVRILMIYSRLLVNLQLKEHAMETSRAQREHAVSSAVASVLAGEKRLLADALYSMVPQSVARDLEAGVPSPPSSFEFCTLFFSDIVGFTPHCRQNTPLAVFNLLDRLYTVMDLCVAQFPSLYKVETIGDAYMVVGGILDHSLGQDGSLSSVTDDESDGGDPLHREALRETIINELCQFALLVNECVDVVPMFTNNMGCDSHGVTIRIGLHCGPVVTGLGNVTPRFCLFGDSVNITSRMETTGQAHSVHISDTMAQAITSSKFARLYKIVKRTDLVEIKGAGRMQSYWLEPSDTFPLKSAFEETLNKAKEVTSALLVKQHTLETSGHFLHKRYGASATSSSTNALNAMALPEQSTSGGGSHAIKTGVTEDWAEIALTLEPDGPADCFASFAAQGQLQRIQTAETLVPQWRAP